MEREKLSDSTKLFIRIWSLSPHMYGTASVHQSEGFEELNKTIPHIPEWGNKQVRST
jgi:hypothetical protein